MRDIITLVNKGRVINLLPNFYMETRSCYAISNILDKLLPKDIKIVIRNWETQNTCYEKHIVIITSAEPHNYIPPEIYEDRCVAGFMHYYPKTFAYESSELAFIKVNKLYPLPLGSMRTFNMPKYIPIENRKYDVCFIGQLDTYRRMDFYNAVSTLQGNNYIHFYTGWNKGFAADYYAEILSQSKIALVPCGSASLDTFRFYEACEAGCVILTLKQNNYEFMQGSPHIEMPSWADVRTYIDNLLSKPEKLVEISEKTKQFWNTNLCPEAAAKFMLRKLGVKYE